MKSKSLVFYQITNCKIYLFYRYSETSFAMCAICYNQDKVSYRTIYLCGECTNTPKKCRERLDSNKNVPTAVHNIWSHTTPNYIKCKSYVSNRENSMTTLLKGTPHTTIHERTQDDITFERKDILVSEFLKNIYDKKTYKTPVEPFNSLVLAFVKMDDDVYKMTSSALNDRFNTFELYDDTYKYWPLYIHKLIIDNPLDNVFTRTIRKL
jgi:hypothetical protein